MATHGNTATRQDTPTPNAHLVIFIKIKSQQILRLFDAQSAQFLQVILSKSELSMAIRIEVAKDPS